MMNALPTFARKLTHMADASLAGATVTSHSTVNTKGSYTELLADSGPRACGITVSIHGIATSSTVTSTLVDVAIGAAASEVVILSNLNAWGAQIAEPGYNRRYFFPIEIAANSRISARSQAAISSDTQVVKIAVHQYPIALAACGEIVTYGADTANSSGTSVPQANQPSWGAWTQITSSTSRPHNIWACAMDGLADTTLADQHAIIELGVGASPGAAFASFIAETDGSEVMGSCYPELHGSTIVPDGSAIYARMKANSNAENRGIIIYAGFVNSWG